MIKLNQIYNQNCLTGLKNLPENSIDCCVTSPPYWGLRDYGHDEQLGSEDNFKDFINKLCDIFDEVQRVLKPTGTCFVNLGDSYASDTKGSGGTHYPDGTPYKQTTNKGSRYGIKKFDSVFPNKCLLMIPERFSIEMIDRNWILRNQIIWHKPNQMPASVTDRFTVDFEKIFFFAKNATGYYFEQQIESTKAEVIEPRMLKEIRQTASETSKYKGFQARTMTRNMRTVWSVNTKPNSEAHFATYPQTLVERMIKSGCPENGIVLDPFFGSGTTGLAAKKLNRNFIGYELNPEYVKLAENRIMNELGLFA